MSPILSIVTINYNNADGLSRTLASCLPVMKNCANVELIIVDGCSSDHFLDVIEAYKSLSNLWVCSEPDDGIYDAMNKGMRLMKGAFVVFINSGDEMHDPWLWMRLVRYLARLQAGDRPCVIYGDNLMHNGYRHSRPPRRCRMTLASGELFACHQAIIFPRYRTAKGIFYDKRYVIFGDHDFICRYVNKKIPLLQIRMPLVKFEGGGLSSRATTIKRIEKLKSVFTNYLLFGLLLGGFNSLRTIISRIVKS